MVIIANNLIFKEYVCICSQVENQYKKNKECVGSYTTEVKYRLIKKKNGEKVNIAESSGKVE